jgi:hypothetical protein
VKVCRGKNKPYMYWLFNDCLLYGTSLPGGLFTFNRWCDTFQTYEFKILRIQWYFSTCTGSSTTACSTAPPSPAGSSPATAWCDTLTSNFLIQNFESRVVPQ